jgi:hypothetical protein
MEENRQRLLSMRVFHDQHSFVMLPLHSCHRWEHYHASSLLYNQLARDGVVKGAEPCDSLKAWSKCYRTAWTFSADPSDATHLKYVERWGKDGKECTLKSGIKLSAAFFT